MCSGDFLRSNEFAALCGVDELCAVSGISGEFPRNKNQRILLY
jgi:hypothetical protein